MQRYARPTLEAILRHQVRQPGSPLHGAVAQNSFHGLKGVGLIIFAVGLLIDFGLLGGGARSRRRR